MSKISALKQDEVAHRIDSLHAEHSFNEDERSRLNAVQNLPEALWDRMFAITVRQILQAREQKNRPKPMLEQIQRLREACRSGELPFVTEEVD